MNLGETIKTAEGLDALPERAAVVYVNLVWTSFSGRWETAGGLRWTAPSFFSGNHDAPVLVYLPGQPPRPEWAVKAEALRKAARSLEGRVEGLAVALLLSHADRIERGEKV